MNETTKRVVLVIIAIAAVAAAGFSAFKSMTSDQPVSSGVSNAAPPGSKTGKQLEMEGMKKAAGGGKEERDLSGALGK